MRCPLVDGAGEMWETGYREAEAQNRPAPVRATISGQHYCSLVERSSQYKIRPITAEVSYHVVLLPGRPWDGWVWAGRAWTAGGLDGRGRL